MDQIQKFFSKPQRDSEGMKAFGYRLKNQFAENESYRRMKELEWLEDLRQYKGLYDPITARKLDANASKVYPKITRSKVNIVLSRLHEMLFPETDKNWEIEPTPEPKIAPEIVKQLIIEEVQKRSMESQGQQPIEMPGQKDIRLAVKRYSDECCANMSNVIDDQLTEMDYPEETKKVLRSGLTYGTGVMKGPMINKRTKRTWEPLGISGDYKESEDSEELPYFTAVRIWDWYPDMTTTEIDKIEGAFERHIMSRHDIRELLKRDDFYAEMIKEYLDDHPSGDYVPKEWELDLQTIEVEASAGEGKFTTATSSSATSTQPRTSNRQIGKRYQVLEYWGYVDGSDLEACGVEVADTSLEYAANVWLLGNVPIKAVLFDGALKQYKVFYYEKDETSLFGEGLVRVMRHSQLAIAGAARMVLDNGAVCSGPQVEVNWNLLTPDTDLNSFYPRKIWYREGRGVEAQYPAIRSLQFDSHIPELLKIIEAFKQFADEETTLPTWMIGQMVNNETAQATSGRMATITISIKDVVKNFDTFTEKIIRDLYAWNMEFNQRTDIKGDYKVQARGVSSLVMKEIRMQALAQLTTTLTPEERVYIPTRDFLVDKMKAHDVNIKLLTEEEADEVRKANDSSEMAQLQKESMRAEIAKDKAMAMAQLTRAKERNVIANKEATTPPETAQPQDPRINDAEYMKKMAEVDDQKTKTQLQIERQRAEEGNMAREMEQKGMEGRLKMIHADEKHRTDIELKKKTAEHGLKMKEKQASKPKKKGI